MHPFNPFASLRSVALCALLPLSAGSLQANISWTGTFTSGPLANEIAQLTLATSGSGTNTSLDGVTIELSDASAVGFATQRIFTYTDATSTPSFSASFDATGDLLAIDVLFGYFDDSFTLVNFGLQDPSVNNNRFNLEVEPIGGSLSSAELTPIPEPNQAALLLGLIALSMIATARRAKR